MSVLACGQVLGSDCTFTAEGSAEILTLLDKREKLRNEKLSCLNIFQVFSIFMDMSV